MTALDSVRRPEYTGANRCWPCTTLNLVLLAVGAVLLGLVWAPAGAAAAAVGAVAVWLRGYLVPYTPRFAPQVADRLPVAFKSGADGRADVPAEPGSLSGAGPADPDAVLATLLDAGVLVADADAVALSGGFADDWAAERDRLLDRSGAALAAAVADAAPSDPAVSVHEIDSGEWVRIAGDPDVLLSRPVAVAEVAAVRALADAGVALDAETRATAASALRAFLETCPVCDADLVESSTADCCGGMKADPKPVLRCPDCDRAVYTFPET